MEGWERLVGKAEAQINGKGQLTDQLVVMLTEGLQAISYDAVAVVTDVGHGLGKNSSSHDCKISSRRIKFLQAGVLSDRAQSVGDLTILLTKGIGHLMLSG